MLELSGKSLYTATMRQELPFPLLMSNWMSLPTGDWLPKTLAAAFWEMTAVPGAR